LTIISILAEHSHGGQAYFQGGFVMKTLRLELTYPEKLIKKPVIYDLVKQFDVVPNIRRANVDETFGWMVLEISGEDDALEAAVAHLREIGIEVEHLETFVE
jgi:ABC-type methionine transport system ATPase subunit